MARFLSGTPTCTADERPTVNWSTQSSGLGVKSKEIPVINKCWKGFGAHHYCVIVCSEKLECLMDVFARALVTEWLFDNSHLFFSTF